MNQWKERSRPTRLERRFEFENYEATRVFLDKLGKLCEAKNRFPDISFGKTYVNLTLMPDNEELEVSVTEFDREIALEIDLLVD